jgi:hypothetical protein
MAGLAWRETRNRSQSAIAFVATVGDRTTALTPNALAAALLTMGVSSMHNSPNNLLISFFTSSVATP